MQLPNTEFRSSGERGSAMIEFFLLGIVLLVPLSLGMADLSNYFSALMAGENAAREAARAYSLADTSRIGASQAEAIALRVLADSGVRYRDFTLRIICSAQPCLTPSGSIRTIVDFNTDLRTVSRPIHIEEVEPISSWVTSR